MEDYSINSPYVRGFDKAVLDFIDQGVDCQNPVLFNELALKEFRIQFNTVDYYRKYCEDQGLTPDKVESWEQIPALPAQEFKNNIIAGFPLHETELTIMTSGTSNPNFPSKIYRDKRCVEMYFKANTLLTKSFLFPDVEKMKILLMVPSPKVAPAMGMAVGLEQLRQNFGTEDSQYLISPDGMEWELLFSALHNAEDRGEPVALVGATSGLVYLYQFCLEQGLKFRLPHGSRICDGGGYLGTFGECSREDYLGLCKEVLNVEAEYCVNTLGSGESTTNYFDNVLRNHFLGRSGIPRYKACPPWARTIVVDPKTGRRLPKGERGLLRHYDLANRANLLAVQSNNLGYETEAGFEIIGRVDAINKAHGTMLNIMITGGDTCSTVANEMLAGGQATCSTVANEMLVGEQATCSTVANEMLAGGQASCSTVANKMLVGEQATCSTVATEMLAGGQENCSTVADEFLTKAPQHRALVNLPRERLEKLKGLCPFLRLQGLLKK